MFDVGGALNESAHVQDLAICGQHLLVVQPPASSALAHHITAQQFYIIPLDTYSLTQLTYADYSAVYHQTWSAITDPLPLNVHLLTLDQLSAKNYLIRLEHYFELNDDDTYSKAVTIDLQSIFQSVGDISNAVELTFAANLALTDLQRLNWATDDEQLNPMTIPSLFHQ